MSLILSCQHLTTGENLTFFLLSLALYSIIIHCSYRIFLIEDCCGDRDVQVHKSVMSTYDGYNCVVIKSEQIINNFKSNEK